MSGDRCMNCGTVTAVEELDGKPKRLRGPNCTHEQLGLAADAGEQFEWLEGPCCYGPAYNTI